MKINPMDEWVLRDELLSAFHRWPVIVAFILLGCLLGLAFAFVWPSQYRATTELSVELNPYRALDDRYVSEFAGFEFRNVDDYKHWQMSQLSIIVLSDPYLEETRSRLILIDPYWESIGIQELREMLKVSWRNAGLWQLSAEADSSERAVEALETWQDVILDLSGNAIATSRGLFELELQLRSLNDQLLEAQECLPILEETRTDLTNLTESILEANPDEIPAQSDRMQLTALVFRVKDCDSGWQLILDQFPGESSPASDYAAWADLFEGAINQGMTTLETQINYLNEEISSVNSAWEADLKKAQGLSASLTIELPSSDLQDVSRIRTSSLAALVGGLMGLLAWFMLFLLRITRASYQ
jgi:hypothetical protein